ncbi:hypothetical protein A4X06_0g4672 [Tilletia controversa]|uniref:Uncharacterized protein n=1 Tax=Tilletia controversa TaxID=13291 RepID=A0A8X7MRW8_9BASI|nr:hypothetical protein A4X06_0g4672 [Tilletia controversa]
MVGTMILVAGNSTRQTALLVDLFLQPEYRADKKRSSSSPIATTRPPSRSSRARCTRACTSSPLLWAKNRLVVGTSKAHMDPTAFPNPEKLNTHRPREQYFLLGVGLHFCFDARLIGPAIASMLKETSSCLAFVA